MRSNSTLTGSQFGSLLSMVLAGTSLACSGNDSTADDDEHHHDEMSDHDHDRDDDHDHDHDDDKDDHGSPVFSGRLLVSDGAVGRVVVIDLEQGKAIESLTTTGAARVYASSNGVRGFAVQGSEDAVQGIDPGIRYESHGDHFDVEKTTPRVLSELVVSCSRPVHFVPHHDYSAAFCDGDGMLHVFEDTSATSTYELMTFDSGRPHHGVGLAAFDRILVSNPNLDDEDDALPIGVRALNSTAMKKPFSMSALVCMARRRRRSMPALAAATEFFACMKWTENSPVSNSKIRRMRLKELA